jgi:hypothetical protein
VYLDRLEDYQEQINKLIKSEKTGQIASTPMLQ